MRYRQSDEGSGNRRSGRDELLADWRALNDQLLDVTEFFCQARLGVWQEEIHRLEALWQGMSSSWSDHLMMMATEADQRFDQIAGRAETASNSLARHFSQALLEVSRDLDQLEGQLSQALKGATQLQGGSAGSGGSAADPWSWAGNLFGGGWLDILDWFHEGGVVRAHQGMVLEPEYMGGASGLASDERVVVAQTGEGILPRESMARLGRENFEALRTGRFETQGTPAPASPTYQISIQVQALDTESLAGFNWERMVKRHILPVLQRDRRRL